MNLLDRDATIYHPAETFDSSFSAFPRDFFFPHRERTEVRSTKRCVSAFADRFVDYGDNVGVASMNGVLLAFAWLMNQYTGQGQVAFGLSFSGMPSTVDGSVAVSVDVDRMCQSEIDLLNRFHVNTIVPPSTFDIIPVAFEYNGLNDGNDTGSACPTSEFVFKASKSKLGFDVEIIFDSNRFESASIEWFLDNFVALSERLSSGGNWQDMDTSFLSPPEKRGLLNRLDGSARSNENQMSQPRQTRIEVQLANLARQKAGLIAVDDGQNRLTYGELDRIANCACLKIREAKERPVRIALLFGQDTAAVVGILSALKAKAAFVPIDPRLPNARISVILRETQPDLVLHDKDYSKRISDLECGLPSVEFDLSGKETDENWLVSDTEESATDFAYLLPTSGTTGAPKLVQQTHANVLHHAKKYISRLSIQDTDRVLMVARYSFDAAMMDIFGALLAGAQLQILDLLETNQESSASRLANFAPTILHFTPTVFRHLAHFSDETFGLGEQSVRPRAVVFGGEELFGNDIALCRHAFGDQVMIINGYGPSECTLAAQHVVAPGEESLASVPFGQALDLVSISLYDDKGHPAPLFGEVYIHCDAVAVGYLNNPKDTEQAFSQDQNGERFFRTGDLARQRFDGTYVYCSRKDTQVKVRGNRIDLKEIEHLLISHPMVAQASVLIEDEKRFSDRFQQRILAFVTPSTPIVPGPADLIDFLTRHLPAMAVPQQIFVLEELPLRASGKLDRARLLELEQTPDHELVDQEQGGLRSRVREIWQDVLECDIRDLDNFQHLGGDSLQMLRMLFAIQNEFSVVVPIQSFIENPSLTWLVKFVGENR